MTVADNALKRVRSLMLWRIPVNLDMSSKPCRTGTVTHYSQPTDGTVIVYHGIASLTLLNPQTLDTITSNVLIQALAMYRTIGQPRIFYARNAYTEYPRPENPYDILNEVNCCARTAAAFLKETQPLIYLL